MPQQLDLDKTYIKMAREWASLSKAKKLQVGCLIVKDGSIISDGYNGTPRGFDNQCEDTDYFNQLITRQEVLHAESNAITKLAKSTQSSVGSTMYVTTAPCIECAKLIIQSDITRVIYSDFYRSNAGINLLKKANVKVEQCSI